MSSTDSKHDEKDPAVVAVEGADEEVAVDFRTWAVVGVAAFGSYLTFLHIVTASFFYTVVAAAFTDTGSSSAWLPSAFQLVQVALAAPLCLASDVLGRRWFVIVAFTLTAAGSLMIGRAKSFDTVIAGSAVSSGMYVAQGAFYSIPAEVLPRRYRGLGATITISAGGLGGVSALLISGACIRDNVGGEGWRVPYYILTAASALVALGFVFLYHPLPVPNPQNKTTRQRLAELDYVGSLLLLVFGAFMVPALVMGGQAYPWSSPRIIALLVVGSAAFLALILHQVFVNREGIFHKDLFRSRNYPIALFGVFVEGVIFLCLNVVYPLQTSFVYESRTFFGAARFVPFFAGFIICAPIGGWFSRRYKNMKIPLSIGFTLLIVAVAMLATAGVNDGNRAIGAVAIAGSAFSQPLALLAAVSQLAVEPELLGLSTSNLFASRALGTLVGTIMAVSIFSNKIAEFLPAQVAAAALEAGLPATSLPAVIGGIAAHNTTLLMSAEGITPAIAEAAGAAAVHAFSDSFHFAWYAVIPFIVLALGLVLSLDSEAIKTSMDWRVERPLGEVHLKHHEVSA